MNQLPYAGQEMRIPLYRQADSLSLGSAHVLGYHDGEKWKSPDLNDEYMVVKTKSKPMYAPKILEDFIVCQEGVPSEGCYLRKIYHIRDDLLKDFESSRLDKKLPDPYFDWIVVQPFLTKEMRGLCNEKWIRPYDLTRSIPFPLQRSKENAPLFEEGENFERITIGILEYRDISSNYFKDLVSIVKDNKHDMECVFQDVAKACDIKLTPAFVNRFCFNPDDTNIALGFLLMYNFKYCSPSREFKTVPVKGRIGHKRCYLLRKAYKYNEGFTTYRWTPDALSRHVQFLTLNYDGPTDMFLAYCDYVLHVEGNVYGVAKRCKMYAEWIRDNTSICNFSIIPERDRYRNTKGVFFEWCYFGDMMRLDRLYQMDHETLSMFAAAEFGFNIH